MLLLNVECGCGYLYMAAATGPALEGATPTPQARRTATTTRDFPPLPYAGQTPPPCRPAPTPGRRP